LFGGAGRAPPRPRKIDTAAPARLANAHTLVFFFGPKKEKEKEKTMGNGAFIPLGRKLVLGVDIWSGPPTVIDRSVVLAGPDGLPGTAEAAVPARVVARLLTHSHTDHTAGLKPDWAADGPGSRLHCSRAAAAHLGSMFPGGRLAARLVEVGPGDCLRMRRRRTGGDGGGKKKRRLQEADGGAGAGAEADDDEENDRVLAEVHVLPANHCVVRFFVSPFFGRACPDSCLSAREKAKNKTFLSQKRPPRHTPRHSQGSLMFLVRSPGCGTVLHTGDCRFEAAALRSLLAQVRRMRQEEERFFVSIHPFHPSSHLPRK
jgi:glyoxylase-like metal-dependent hydrolase (beta-lactamase superfamily II)